MEKIESYVDEIELHKVEQKPAVMYLNDKQRAAEAAEIKMNYENPFKNQSNIKAYQKRMGQDTNS